VGCHGDEIHHPNAVLPLTEQADDTSSVGINMDTIVDRGDLSRVVRLKFS
jgi:hypothetical protein